MQRKWPCFFFGSLSLLLTIVVPASVAFASSTEQVLYRFQGGSDGNSPQASMIADKAGNLYGTTSLGGGSANCTNGCGTAFKLAPPTQTGGAWTETILHSFQGGADGATPFGGLIADAAGNLFGMTSAGGNGNCANVGLTGCGTVFELSPSGTGWTYQVIYSFQGVPSGNGNGDAGWPNALAFDKVGNLFGTAYDGGHCVTNETGTNCYGAVFELKKPSGSGGWNEHIVLRFFGPTGGPASATFDKAGNLYGTALWGTFGFGLVFKLAPPTGKSGWTESAIYNFQGNGDGGFPLPGLVFDAAGNLYGACLGPGYGFSSVFRLSPVQGGGFSESVLYNFTPVSQGYLPTGGPILGKNGDLFGTTSEGGAVSRGAVYDLVPSGGAYTENVLYSFQGGTDGAVPAGGLNFGKGGALYGTTAIGGGTGCGGNGCGTVFRVMP